MTEKTTFREHIVQDLGVCPQGIFSGKTMDADRKAPNGGIIEWEF